MNVLIVEDEAPAARRLKRLVSAALAVDHNQIITASSLEAALQTLSTQSIDLMLLDLDLSGRDGFEVLRKVDKKAPATIIVSANVDRAIAAFDHDVIDFVAKPVSEERLSRALTRAKNAVSNETRLVIRAQGRTDIIAVPSIVRFSGAGDYVEVKTSDGQLYLHDEKLDVLEKRLPPSFVRVHRSHIVNMAHAAQMRRLEKDRRVVITECDEEIPVSRRRAALAQKALAAF